MFDFEGTATSTRTESYFGSLHRHLESPGCTESMISVHCQVRRRFDKISQNGHNTGGQSQPSVNRTWQRVV